MDLPATLTSASVTPAQSMPGAAHVLILDDQQVIRSLLRDVLETNGYQVSLAQNIGEADALLASEPFDTVMLDIFLGAHEHGLSLLPRIATLQPQTPTIVISGMANMDHVIEALKAGAYDMLVKPFNIIDVLHVVARAVEKKRMAEENVRLVEALLRERDLLEVRVQAATSDLQEKVETLRQLNQQVSTMFEMSQMPTDGGSSEGLIHHIFESMRRIIDFDGAFCVVYDIKAGDITLTHSDGPGMKAICEAMTALFRDQDGALVELAESEEHLPVVNLQAAMRHLYPGTWPGEDMMLMPLHVHQTLMGVVGVVRGRRSTHLTQVEERILALAISHFLAALEQRSFIARTGQLAGLGELISEIAHDLRHPMTALRGASHILEGGWRNEAKRNRCLDEIQNNLGRMESLVSELVNFYNPKEMNMVSVDAHTLLDKALAIGGPLLEQKGIEVVREYDPGPLRILGLTRNLIEAFINLIANACQAMAPGGRLRVATTAELSEAQRHRLRQRGHQPGSYILIKVEDNGCGIPDEHKERVFHRFFTTRPEGHGLGLAAVQRIIKKNLGHIDLESQVGVGTTFFLFLPKA